MESQIPPKSYSKSAIAVAVIAFVGGLGFTIGAAIDDQAQGHAANTVTTASAVKIASQATPASGVNALITVQGGDAIIQTAPARMIEVGAATHNANGYAQTGAAALDISQEHMARMELPADFVPNNAQGATDGAPFERIALKEFSFGAKAIALLDKDLDAVAHWYGMSSNGFRQLLLTDTSVHLDRKGRVLHIDGGVPTDAPQGTQAGGVARAGTTSAAATAVATNPFPLDQTFKLHTRPGSTRVLYLNFTGQGSNPAFDLDNLPGTFSLAEQTLIQKVWQRVAEDYAPFDVDITTESPAVPAGKTGATILITPRVHSAGGYAYLNAFARFAAGDAPAFCFPNNLSNNEKPIGECVSHELGHTLGLIHQGANPSTAYYGGQGTGETGWAPIMGISYYKNLTQWSKGEYTNANNKEDAYAVMSRQGLKPRPDDAGNTIAAAAALLSKSANGLNNLNGEGVIEVPGDVDMYSFVAGAGSVSFKVNTAVLGGNLDVALQILDAKGKVLASANTDSTLATAISVKLTAQGVYYLSVTGAGKGSALTNGYSNYGSLGQYSISGTAALTTGSAPTPPPATPEPAPAPSPPPPPAKDVPPPVRPSEERSVKVTFNASGVRITGATIKSYTWDFGDGTAKGKTAVVTHTYTKTGTFQGTLTVVDSKSRSVIQEFSITIR
jgi:hypothetical protein